MILFYQLMMNNICMENEFRPAQKLQRKAKQMTFADRPLVLTRITPSLNSGEKRILGESREDAQIRNISNYLLFDH